MDAAAHGCVPDPIVDDFCAKRTSDAVQSEDSFAVPKRVKSGTLAQAKSDASFDQELAAKAAAIEAAKRVRPPVPLLNPRQDKLGNVHTLITMHFGLILRSRRSVPTD